MCTVTIYRQPEHLLVTMNRDERWTRASETPPALHQANSGSESWIGPTDGERGGTWIGANTSGVVACILNAYAEGDMEMLGRSDVPSRGEIIPALLDRDRNNVFRFVERDLDPTPYPSFVLMVATSDSGLIVRWTLGSGVEYESVDQVWSLVTSSWWRSNEVASWRRGRFEGWLESGSPFDGLLPSFNLLEEPGEREYSPFMTRSFSGTRSVTQISLERMRSDVEMRYWAREGEGAIDPLRLTSSVELPLSPVLRRDSIPCEPGEHR
jgi:hypothetical protein